ncbi:hypothetical protein [Azohydromonas lata]|uniref:Uncharacterized protein n=1 Tax=Azohydromonas lata TaxID=45677 RepID=A0ABU5I931_9BURK|nr:hypothetical protein [Azohydromonas lata]MDZ5455349.1 hypothetical protein [Azohydromonas lata]
MPATLPPLRFLARLQGRLCCGIHAGKWHGGWWVRHCRHPQSKAVLELVKRRGG